MLLTLVKVFRKKTIQISLSYKLRISWNILLQQCLNAIHI